MKPVLSVKLYPVISNANSFTQKIKSIVSLYKRLNWLKLLHAMILCEQVGAAPSFGKVKLMNLGMVALMSMATDIPIYDTAKLMGTRFQNTICKKRQES